MHSASAVIVLPDLMVLLPSTAPDLTTPQLRTSKMSRMGLACSLLVTQLGFKFLISRCCRHSRLLPRHLLPHAPSNAPVYCGRALCQCFGNTFGSLDAAIMTDSCPAVSPTPSSPLWKIYLSSYAELWHALSHNYADATQKIYWSWCCQVSCCQQHMCPAVTFEARTMA